VNWHEERAAKVGSKSGSESGGGDTVRRYLLEHVDDVAVVQIYADGFSSLSLREKQLTWHLYLAALAGRDIYYDQRYAHNLEIRAVLEGIVTQALVPKAGGRGRAMAAEVLVVTPAIRALIRDDKVHQIYSSMQSGKKFGMQTLNDALYALYMNKEITADDALKVTSSPDEFLKMIGKEPGNEEKPSSPGSRPLTGGLSGRR